MDNTGAQTPKEREVIHTLKSIKNPTMPKFRDPFQYGMNMVCDFSKTLAIFREIVSWYSRAKWEERHIWYDLWSNTGILLLAQYIRAKYQGISIEWNIWIEIHKDIATRANRLISSLDAGKVVYGNTTKYSYDGNATFFTNENLPYQWVSFNKWGQIEPFFQNITRVQQQVHWEYHHFPERVVCSYDTSFWKESFTCDKTNIYGVDAIKMANHDDQIFRRISPTSISLKWIDIPLSKVGWATAIELLVWKPLVIWNDIRRW
jgi:hypothetical protein